MWLPRSVQVNGGVGLKTNPLSEPPLRKATSGLAHAHLQRRQQVAGFSQASPGSVQLLQQLVLRLLERADLSLGGPDVLLPPLNILLQPSHLWAGRTGGGGG